MNVIIPKYHYRKKPRPDRTDLDRTSKQAFDRNYGEIDWGRGDGSKPNKSKQTKRQL